MAGLLAATLDPDPARRPAMAEIRDELAALAVQATSRMP
jgi:hypothetical protein